MTATSARAWGWATTALALSLALGVSWCIVRSPLTLYDGLGPILDARSSPSIGSMFEGGLRSSGYWRPLRVTQIKLIVDAAPDDPTGAFKAVHVALTLAVFVLFSIWVRPRSMPEFTAAGIALMIVAGHHSFFVLFSEAYPVNHFLEIVALTLVIAVLARGAPAWWKDLLAPLLLAIGALTIESGLLVGVVAIACWMAGWRGISSRGIGSVVLVLIAYFVLRFLVFDVPSPGLDERATGWWLGRLEPAQLVERFGANPLPLYAYNLMAALLSVLTSEPRGGVWLISERWLADSFRPWMGVHMVSSVLVTGAMLAALVPALGRWRHGTIHDRDRFVLVACALVAANTALSFGYVKDEVLSVGAVFYAGGAFAALAALADRAREQRGAAVAAALLLLCISVLWTTRAAGTFFSLQASAYKVANDWAVYSMERELPADWAVDAQRRTFLDLRQRSVSLDVPHPAFTRQRRMDRYVEVQ